MAKTQTVKKPNLFFQLLKSCISNQTAIDASKDHAWWVAIIIAFVSIIIAAVPIFVSIVTVNGSDYFKSYSYDMDTNLVHLVDNIGTNKLKVTNHVLSYEGTTLTEDGDIVDPYEMVISEPGVIGFRAIYINGNYADISFTKYTETFLKRGAAGEDEGTNYLPNFLFFYNDGFRIMIGTQATDTCLILDTYNSFNFKDINDTNDLISDWISTVPGKDIRRVEYMNNFKNLLTESYKSTKTTSVVRQTGIYLGVYAGAVLLLGLMIFLMTRGKRNPFNFMTFNDSFKISAWASVSPAILALIFGFLMSSSSLGTIFFVLTHGLRIMWLSMNQLRPQ